MRTTRNSTTEMIMKMGEVFANSLGFSTFNNPPIAYNFYPQPKKRDERERGELNDLTKQYIKR